MGEMYAGNVSDDDYDDYDGWYMSAAPFTIERGRAALAAILSAFETPPHLGKKIIRQYASSECVENLLSIAQRLIWSCS